MKLDLHCHSHCSDGKLAPEQLLSLALAENLSLFAITDHDTVDAYYAPRLQAAPKPEYFVTGVELSSQWLGHNIHIVGLDFSIETPEFQQFIAKQKAIRLERVQLIDKRLAAANMPNVLSTAQSLFGAVDMGRPHLAQAMCELGYVKNIKQAFAKHLGNGKLGDVKQFWPDMAQAVAVIRKARGVAVLAHPLKYKMTATKRGRLLAAFKQAGGQAVEIGGQGDSPEKRDVLLRQILALQLAVSAGSDFHSPDWAYSKIGHVPALPKQATAVWQLFENTPVISE